MADASQLLDCRVGSTPTHPFECGKHVMQTCLWPKDAALGGIDGRAAEAQLGDDLSGGRTTGTVDCGDGDAR